MREHEPEKQLHAEPDGQRQLSHMSTSMYTPFLHWNGVTYGVAETPQGSRPPAPVRLPPDAASAGSASRATGRAFHATIVRGSCAALQRGPSAELLTSTKNRAYIIHIGVAIVHICG